MPDAVIVHSPLGPVRVSARDAALTAVTFIEPDEARVCGPAPSSDAGLLAEAARQLEAYFDGRLRHFDLPLDPAGTPFERTVWDLLRAIPFGRTRSYADLARDLGRPGAARAVGRANAANPIGIIIPCHRVIRADGALCGYAAGVERKDWLLRHEGARADGPALPFVETTRRAQASPSAG